MSIGLIIDWLFMVYFVGKLLKGAIEVSKPSQWEVNCEK